MDNVIPYRTLLAGQNLLEGTVIHFCASSMVHHLEGHTVKRASLLFLLKAMVAGRVNDLCNITHSLTIDKAVKNTASLEAEHACIGPQQRKCVSA